MADTEVLPRLFGSYLLTEKVGVDALGRVYRSRKADDPNTFFRVRLLEAPGLDYESVITAIEQNGAVHDFLKNPAIARDVEMDSVEGDPFLAYREPGGRTLDLLMAVARSRPFPIPVEHSLLIAEKIATGLDHAYNTLIDGERTLHGLVIPGFVEISDDGETRLYGFGLAEGILASRSTAAIRDHVFPYLAPEVRESGKPSREGDVYSNGAILLAMLVGAPPPLEDAAGAVAGAKLFGHGEPLPADIAAVLRTALAASPEARYETAGALRRELGKLLFSGRYSPSTFNLAFFLTNLFKDQIAAEQAKRDIEAGLNARAYPRHAPAVERPPRPVAVPRFGARPFESEEPPPKKRPPAGILIGALVGVAVVAGALIALVGRSAPKAAPPRPAPPPARASATPAPPPPAPAQPTGGMTPDQYKEEVARRVAEEMQKLESEQKARQEKAAAARIAALRPQPTAVAPGVEAPKPLPISPAPAAPAPSPAAIPVTPAPAPRAPAVKRGDLVDIGEVDSPPQITNVIKPEYPPIARQMNVSGTVILSVLVTETGRAAEVRVLRGAGGKMGLNEAAARAVRQWTFKPAMKNGVPVRTWFTVPIPFVL